MVNPIMDEYCRMSRENKKALRERDDLREETDRVRREMEELKRESERQDVAFQAMQAELERERKTARANLKAARRRLDVEAKLASQALQKERARNDKLEHQLGIHDLERVVKTQAKRMDDTKLVTTLRKLICKSPHAGKKLAVALHPDKVPMECGDLAAELFTFVQGVRDSNSS
jgi:small-conductance mechanosensitive channel